MNATIKFIINPRKIILFTGVIALFATLLISSPILKAETINPSGSFSEKQYAADLKSIKKNIVETSLQYGISKEKANNV